MDPRNTRTNNVVEKWKVEQKHRVATKGCKSKFAYFMRAVDSFEDYVEPIDEVINDIFLPVLFCQLDLLDLLRSTVQTRDNGASSWLNAVALEEQDLTLNKQQFRDLLHLHYNLAEPLHVWRSIHSQPRPVV